MSSRLIKICMRPGCKNKFGETSHYFNGEFCSCGAPLLVKREEIELVNDVFGETNSTTKSNKIFQHRDIFECEESNVYEIREVEEQELVKEQKPVFVLDDCGGIHFDFSKEEKLLDEDRIVIYLDGYIYKEIPLEYDETIFGRKSSLFEPDVDLSSIDSAKKTSRKHLMVFRNGSKYFARNLSDKNSVHIEKTTLVDDMSLELKDNDLIILSRSVVMVFKEGR